MSGNRRRQFICLMYPRVDAPSDFDYPAERLLKLRGILSAEEIRKPNSKDHKNEPMRYVIKRGPVTLTTIGCLNGEHDSVEAAVYTTPVCSLEGLWVHNRRRPRQVCCPPHLWRRTNRFI